MRGAQRIQRHTRHILPANSANAHGAINHGIGRCGHNIAALIFAKGLGGGQRIKLCPNAACQRHFGKCDQQTTV